MTRRQRGSRSTTKKQVYRKVYRFRMEPTREQAEALLRLAGARRWVWNWGLARRKEFYAATGRGLNYRPQAAELTAVKKRPETAWLREADSQLLQQALQDHPSHRSAKRRHDRAFVAFFEGRARFPRFKRRKQDEPRFRIPQRVRVEGSRVYIKGVAVGDTGS